MKVLLPDLSDQKDLADRFLREIKVLASLHHPNIAELRTALTIENQLVMIMEYVEGSTLASVAASRRPLCRRALLLRSGARRARLRPPQHRPSRHQARQHHAHAEES